MSYLFEFISSGFVHGVNSAPGGQKLQSTTYWRRGERDCNLFGMRTLSLGADCACVCLFRVFDLETNFGMNLGLGKDLDWSWFVTFKGR